jgi:hypothetical protein
VFTIAVGPDADVELLRAIASTEGHYHGTTGAVGLVSVYETVAAMLPCD